MDLSDTTGKIPATPGIDPGTFRLVPQALTTTFKVKVKQSRYRPGVAQRVTES